MPMSAAWNRTAVGDGNGKPENSLTADDDELVYFRDGSCRPDDMFKLMSVHDRDTPGRYASVLLVAGFHKTGCSVADVCEHIRARADCVKLAAAPGTILR